MGEDGMLAEVWDPFLAYREENLEGGLRGKSYGGERFIRLFVGAVHLVCLHLVHMNGREQIF